MSFFSKIGNFLTGGLGDKIIETVKDYYPPSMSDSEKAQLEQAIKQSARKYELELLDIAQKEQFEFNNRIKQMEGTAKDLERFGIIGSLVVFLRGIQRPFWGFATFYLDNKWFFGSGEFSEKQEAALMIINILVLAFLFGERAMKNITPLIARILEAKGIGSSHQKTSGK